MIYWYRDLMISKKLKKKRERHIRRVEQYYRATPKSKIFSDKKRSWEHFVGKKIPWKEYFIVIRATNPNNLFEVMSTRQLLLRHYERTDLYVIGLYSSNDEALEAVQEMLIDGYSGNTEYSPRDEFSTDDAYECFSAEDVE